MERMRGSFLLLGALVARAGEASIAKPGGDDIGMRRVEQHLEGLRLMGAEVEEREGGYVAPGLGTVVCDTGALSTTANGSGWQMSASIFKYGIAGSNTQICIPEGTIAPTLITASGALNPAFATAAENAAIYLCITANCATSPGDIGLNLFEVRGIN